MSDVREKMLKALEHRKAGRFDEAIAGYQGLLQENPTVTEIKKVLGHTYREAGRLEEALQVYQDLVQDLPDMAGAIYTWIGALYRRMGRHDEAIDIYEQSLQLEPDKASTYNNLGNVYCDLDRYDEAAAVFHKAIELDPNMSVGYNGLGIAYRHLNRLKEAFANYKQAIRLNPAYPDPYVDMGVMLIDTEQYADAETCFIAALSLNPRMALAYEGLGVVLMSRKESEQALQMYQQAVSLNPHSATIYNNIGNCLQTMERFEEAQVALETAIALNPVFPMAHHNMGVTLGKQKRFEEALTFYDKAIALNPDLTDSLFNRALLWLTEGDFENGWRDYDWRFENVKDFPPRSFRQPMWDGQDLTGKRILVVSEQGFGDTIQFCRYLPWVKARGGTIIFETFPEMTTLLSTLPGVDEWRERPKNLTDDGIDYDVYIYLMSLPRIFNTRIDTIPSGENLLLIPPDKLDFWQQRFSSDKNLKVGIVWASKSENPSSVVRSCRLSDFYGLAELPEITFYSLQKGEAAEQALDPDIPLNLVHLSPDIHDFTDTAAIIENLDLVVSVDTVVAHLAGALGKKTWIILPYQSDWRWLCERQDSPWYPSVQLFRQAAPQQWPEIVAEVKLALSSHQRVGVD